MTLLREELLAVRTVTLAGDRRLGEPLRAAGARVEPAPLEDDDAALESWVREVAPLHALVYVADEDFGDGGEVGLRRALERAWVVTRAVAVGSLIAEGAGGKIVFIAPSAEAGEFAAAAGAALENLARTLSVEWARYGITACAIVPGAFSDAGALAEFVCFLVSPAGDYFSGCRFDLGVVQVAD